MGDKVIHNRPFYAVQLDRDLPLKKYKCTYKEYLVTCTTLEVLIYAFLAKEGNLLENKETHSWKL